jgi:hypothetical protein
MFFFMLPYLPELWLLHKGGLDFLWRQWSPSHIQSARHRAHLHATLAAPGVLRCALGNYRAELGGGSNLGRALAVSLYTQLRLSVFWLCLTAWASWV